ncbi:hypothetical protein BDR22DRAFT_845678 [Usnea florida]
MALATDSATILAGNTTLKGDSHCFPTHPLSVRRPSTRQCIVAIRSLPAGHAHGVFHNSSSGDARFKLPVSKSYGGCEVLVELNSATPEDGTWSGLGVAATRLTYACADRYLMKTGGSIDAGDSDGIKITVQASKVPQRLGNVTIEDITL